MTGPRVTLCAMQVAACLLGVVAGLVPGLSFTAPFQGLYLSQMSVVGATAGPLRVDKVERGSAADRAGFRAGDEILHAGGFDVANADFKAIRPGDRRLFQVRRGSATISVEAVGQRPGLAAAWYDNLWNPIAGAVFLALGLCIYATAPISPPPLWRSIPVGIAGFGMAVGFTVVWATATVFSRLRVWQQFAMGDGKRMVFRPEPARARGRPGARGPRRGRDPTTPGLGPQRIRPADALTGMSFLDS